MKKTITLLLFLLTINTFCQTKKEIGKLNLDFENSQNNTAENWESFGNESYIIGIDSTTAQNGKKSATIAYNGDQPDYKAWAFEIPAHFEGKKIKLTGYIKTENVTDGYAGLWMRLDPSVGFDNMKDRGVTGTTNWKKYEIVLDVKLSNAKTIVVGGLLVGKGKMWIDNLEVTVDGHSLENTPPKKPTIIDTDTAFDSGSKIGNEQLASTKTDDLKTLGLIWGFLKYYHPAVRDGKYNWDYELFRILPKVIETKDTAQRDKILTNWINSLGAFKTENKKPNPKLLVKMQPDLNWISNSGFSPALTAALLHVKNAKRNNKQFYVALYEDVGNPEFLNENAYPKMDYADAGFRLLSLYRYWNMINYYFPYKNLIEKDWKAVLTEFIPRYAKANTELDYKLATLELIENVHDTHANLYDPAIAKFRGENSAPVKVRFAEDRAVVTGFYTEEAKKIGLQIGDVISHVNEKPVTHIIKDALKHAPASNYPTKLREIAISLLRTNDSIIKVTYVRNGILDYKTLPAISRKKINSYSQFQTKDTCFRMINSKIAYLYLGSIKSEYLPKIMKEAENTQGLIIDLRCYPNEFVVFALTAYLTPKKTPFVKFSTGSLTQPGLFTFTDVTEAGGGISNTYKGKVIVLVNEFTQSQAEYTAMAFRTAPNVKIIGSTTAGADGNISEIVLPGNLNTIISGIGVYYPDGKETQRIGIVPDFEVYPSVEGIKREKDEVLEMAMSMIKGK